MIAFSCAHCGMKFQVNPEFAGRSTRCPTCKQPLLVPQEVTVAWQTPSSHIDGPLSSLTRAGVASDVTLAAQAAHGDVKVVRRSPRCWPHTRAADRVCRLPTSIFGRAVRCGTCRR